MSETVTIKDLLDKIDADHEGHPHELEAELVDWFYGAHEGRLHRNYTVNGYRLLTSLDDAYQFLRKMEPRAVLDLTLSGDGRAMAQLGLGGRFFHRQGPAPRAIVATVLMALIYGHARKRPHDRRGNPAPLG